MLTANDFLGRWKEELAASNLTKFMRPFMTLMMIAILQDIDSQNVGFVFFARPTVREQVITLLVAELYTCWCTSYGGSYITNALLFNKEIIVPQAAADLRASSRQPSMYQDDRANSIFGSILFFTDFGDQLMMRNCIGRPSVAAPNQIVAKLQRFLFRLCELRKANMSVRYRWYTGWQDARTRQAALAGIHCQALLF